MDDYSVFAARERSGWADEGIVGAWVSRFGAGLGGRVAGPDALHPAFTVAR